MSAQDGPPKGMETKQVPGYVPAQVVSSDHPGHLGTFAGQEGYTNTPGILDPQESGKDDSGESDSSGTKTAAKKTTPAKSTGGSGS